MKYYVTSGCSYSNETNTWSVHLKKYIIENELGECYNFGSGGGGSGSIFPDNEPLRSGGSQLSVKIDARVESGDRIRRTTQIEFEGPMATWMRWGLDNIGNETLDSRSQWRDIQGSSSTESSRNNDEGEKLKEKFTYSNLVDSITSYM